MMNLAGFDPRKIKVEIRTYVMVDGGVFQNVTALKENITGQEITMEDLLIQVCQANVALIRELEEKNPQRKGLIMKRALSEMQMTYINAEADIVSDFNKSKQE